jgi:hypothetical protein
MKRPKRGGQRPLRTLELPRDVTFHARVLDPFVSAEIDAAVERELGALVRGEDTEHDWMLDAVRVAQLVADSGKRRHYAEWMRAVLLACATVERVEGVTEDDGSDATPSFDLFAALLEEALTEQAFKTQAVLLAINQDDEKNVFGRGPRGRSAAAPSTAPDAAPETIPSSGSLAPEASPSATSTEASSAAPSTNTPPAASPAPSPGASAVAAAAGSPAASAD